MSAEATRPRPAIDWVALSFIVAYHLILLVALPLYLIDRLPSIGLLAWTIGLITAAGMSITVGYHRLFSHRTYQARKPIEFLLVFFGTLATQGSVLRWTHDHRLHHRHVDTEGDPYGTHKGFWHSHLLWLFEKRPPMQARYIADLKDNRLLQHQDRYYGWWVLATNLIVFGTVGWATGDFFGAFVFAFLVRTFFVHHTTWFINSLAHMWGSKPYSTEHSAVNNFILAFLTFGEGYHNYHHTFAGDYRNGIRWYQFDPSKYTIWLMSKLGLAWGLNRTDPLMIRKRLVQADRRLLIDHLNGLREFDGSAFVEAVEKTSEKISETIASAKLIMDRYRALDRRTHREEVQELRRRFRELKREMAHDLRTWRRLCHLILNLEPATA